MILNVEAGGKECGWCCIFIINSISREDHLSVGGSRPSYWGWMDVFRPHYLYLNGKLKYSAKYWHNINTNINHTTAAQLAIINFSIRFQFRKISPKLFRTQLPSPSHPQPLFKQRDHHRDSGRNFVQNSFKTQFLMIRNFIIFRIGHSYRHCHI